MGSATITRAFQVPRTVANGSITIVGTGRAANGRTGTGDRVHERERAGHANDRILEPDVVGR
jgi:hypothetical protein